jgi:hypothetical protein
MVAGTNIHHGGFSFALATSERSYLTLLFFPFHYCDCPTVDVVLDVVLYACNYYRYCFLQCAA